MKLLGKLGTGALLAAVLMATTAQPGAALTLSLGLGNLAISDYPGPYGSVEVKWLTGTTATIKFMSNLGPVGLDGYRYAFGDGGVVDFNLADPANVSVDGWTWTAFNGGSPNVTWGGPGNVDGWGVFNRTFDNTDGFPDAIRDITFNLSRTSGTWASEDDILTANADGYRVAAHIFIAREDYSNTDVTGFATEGLRPIPEPTSLMGLGLGLLGMAVLPLRRRRKA